MSEVLLAMIYDRTAILQWVVSGQEGSDPPEQLAAKLIGLEPENDKDDNLMSFDSGEDFLSRRQKLLEGDEIDGAG